MTIAISMVGNIPLDDKLAYEILKGIYGDSDREELEQKFRVEFAEYIPEETEVTLELVMAVLRLRLGEASHATIIRRLEGKNPPSGYRALSKIVKSKFFNFILTVNLDELLESAFKTKYGLHKDM